MNRKKWIILGVIILLIAVLLPLPWVALIYRNELTFDPVAYINEALKFLGSLSAVFAAFLLVDVFWASEKVYKHAKQIRRVFIFKLVSINNIAKFIINELVAKDNKDAAIKAEANAINSLGNLDSEQEDVAKILSEHGTAIAEDDKLETEILNFIENIRPVLLKYKSYKSPRSDAFINSPRSDAQIIIEDLNSVIKKTDEMINRLQGRQA